MSANHNVEFKQNTQTRDLIALLAYEISPGQHNSMQSMPPTPTLHVPEPFTISQTYAPVAVLPSQRQVGLVPLQLLSFKPHTGSCMAGGGRKGRHSGSQRSQQQQATIHTARECPESTLLGGLCARACTLQQQLAPSHTLHVPEALSPSQT